MDYTPEERREILTKMRTASSVFYAAAANAGCHAFVEFTGLMNEFIKLCSEADEQGIDWVRANIHGDVHLPFKPYHVAYLSEKLECIYGCRLKLVDELVSSKINVAEMRKLSGEDACQACGEHWEHHGKRCAGSAA
jgi:hypothetical protein